MLLLGIDVGTTGVKATVFNEKGEQLGYGFKEYEVCCPRSGWAEQDAEKVWAFTKSVIKLACEKDGAYVEALSLSVQGDAIIPINRNRQAISNAQLGMDYRGVAEVEQCKSILGEKEVFKTTGMRPHPMNSLVKILWIKNNNPELYDRTYKFVTYADFIMGKLGSDELAIDYTMASRTMAFDLSIKEWSSDILDKLGIDKALMANPVESGTVVGTIETNLAKELGINTQCKLVAGGHDQTCAALGAGLIKPGLALDSHGTAEVISTAFDTIQTNNNMYNGYYPCYCHTVPDMYFSFSLNHTGGILLKWIVENLCEKDIGEATRNNQSVYEYVIQRMSGEPSDLMILPHFNGSGTPTCDLYSKGAILGLTMSHTRYDIAKAAIEALSFEARVNLEALKDTGIVISDIRCVGGGARSEAVLQNKADIMGIPVSSLMVREAACLGASMIAGYGVGLYSSYSDAVNNVCISKTYYPRKGFSNIYEEKYELYKCLYEDLRKINLRLGVENGER